MNRIIRRIGDLSARRPWTTIGAWAVLAALVAVLAGAVGGAFTDEFSASGSESGKAKQLLEKRFPGEVVSSMKKELRPGKVFIDWSQNDEHKTTVSVYSLRARERPTASTPLTWDEVEDVLRSGDPEDLAFTAGEVLDRVAEHGDRFAPVLDLQQQLPGA